MTNLATKTAQLLNLKENIVFHSHVRKFFCAAKKLEVKIFPLNIGLRTIVICNAF